MTSSAALEARGVSKIFAGAKQNALSDINLVVEPGEFYSFLGPSGCGKTTMLRIFAGFETASSGRIFVGGATMDGVPANKRPVNMVFQSYALFPHLSVLENVAFGLRASNQKKSTGADILKAASEALAVVRLANMGDRLPAQLSGGQQQRVALARALVMRPVVLLLDEPLSALDVQIREEMQVELSRLQKELGITFVMVTHDQGEALALSSRVAVFNQGQIEQVGNPQEIYQSPRSAFVAQFIGRSNVLRGKVLEVGDRVTVSVLGANGVESSPIICPKSSDPGILTPQVGDSVELCIKPELLLPALVGAIGGGIGRGSAIGPNTLACRIESSAYLGALVDLHLRTAQDVALRATVATSLFEQIRAASSGADFNQQLIVHLPEPALRILAPSAGHV
jgi:spermidine/putrescine transport system ATP-binding protein